MKQKGLVRNMQGNQREKIREFNQKTRESIDDRPGTSGHAGNKKAVQKGKGPITSPSESTIYTNAVKRCNSNRDSSSGDELMRSSGEFKESDSSDDNIEHVVAEFVGNQRLAMDDYDRKNRLQQMQRKERERSQHREDRYVGDRRDGRNDMLRRVEMESDQRGRDADWAKLKTFEVSGKSVMDKFCTSSIDEDFMILGAHVDDHLASKIASGEYINFGKLIPKDKLTVG